MATKSEVISWVCSLADRGIGVDADGAYGMQCVDLPNMVAQKFFGRSMWGNGIDMLSAGQGLGWHTTGGNVLPRAGAIFCMRVSYHGYGHTGIVVGEPDGNGNFQTVEQNVDGGLAGGPARYRIRSLGNPTENIIGFIYPPYSDGIDAPAGGAGQGGGPGGGGPTGYQGETMDFTFMISGDAGWNAQTIWYYNGAINEIQPLHNLEELKYLRAIYNDTHGGRDLKHYEWNTQAPVYVRIFGALKPSTEDNNIKAALNKIIKQLENAT